MRHLVAILLCGGCATSIGATGSDGGAPPDAVSSEAGSVIQGLAGLRIELPCTKDDSATTCETATPTSVVRSMGGDPHVLYQVHIRVRGIVEEKTIREGTVVADSNTFLSSGGDLGNDTYNVYTLDIDAPAQTLYFNRGASGHNYCDPIDYEVTVPMMGGAHLTLAADPVDTAEIKNVDGSGQPLVIDSPDVSPYPTAFNGQFLQIDAIDAVADSTATSPARIDPLLFDGQDARRTITTKDWAPNIVKNECALTQALAGISVGPTNHLGHAVLCTPDNAARFTRGACRAVTFDSTGTASCAPSEAAVGVSMSSGLPEAVLCCSGLPMSATSCSPLTLGATDARESGVVSGDWDPNNVKLECGPGRFVTGATRGTSSQLATITCCGE